MSVGAPPPFEEGALKLLSETNWSVSNPSTMSSGRHENAVVEARLERTVRRKPGRGHTPRGHYVRTVARHVGESELIESQLTTAPTGARVACRGALRNEEFRAQAKALDRHSNLLAISKLDEGVTVTCDGRPTMPRALNRRMTSTANWLAPTRRQAGGSNSIADSLMMRECVHLGKRTLTREYRAGKPHQRISTTAHGWDGEMSMGFVGAGSRGVNSNIDSRSARRRFDEVNASILGWPKSSHFRCLRGWTTRAPEGSPGPLNTKLTERPSALQSGTVDAPADDATTGAQATVDAARIRAISALLSERGKVRARPIGAPYKGDLRSGHRAGNLQPNGCRYDS